MKNLSKKILEFGGEYNIQPNDLLTIALRFASIELARELVAKLNKSLDNLTEEDILNQYLEEIRYDSTESIS
jgi:hypothetical protein